MYVQRNIVARLCNVHTSSAIVIAWCHFTREECFYRNLMSPATIKRTLGLQVKFPNFCPILTKSVTAPNIKFHTNLSSGNRADNSGQAGRQADGLHEANRWFSPLTWTCLKTMQCNSWYTARLYLIYSISCEKNYILCTITRNSRKQLILVINN